MNLIRRTPPKIALLIASLAYLGIGYLISDWSLYEPDPVAALLPVIITLPIFLIVTLWKGSEIYLGRTLIPRIKPDLEMRTMAQAQVERKASVVTLIFAAFVSLAPIVAAYFSKTELTITVFSAAFVWGLLLNLFGLNRLRMAFIIMTHTRNREPIDNKRDINRFRDFTAGLILARASDPSGRWWVNYEMHHDEGAPYIIVTLTDQDRDHESLTTDKPEMVALIGALTGNGNPYQLIYQQNLSQEIEFDGMTAHEKMEAAAYYASAMARVPELRAS